MSDEPRKISIQELIVAITNGDEVDGMNHKKVQDILLLYHYTFTDSVTMLKILLDRVNDKNITDINIRIRGINMIETWMQRHWKSDFQENDEMVHKAEIDRRRISSKPLQSAQSHYLLLVFGYGRNEKIKLKLSHNIPDEINQIIFNYIFPFTKHYDIIMHETAEMVAKRCILILEEEKCTNNHG